MVHGSPVVVRIVEQILVDVRVALAVHPTRQNDNKLFNALDLQSRAIT